MLDAPISLSEKLMYCTTKLVSSIGSGTGYFVNLNVDERIYPILVTNQHVLNHNPDETVSFMLHLESDDGRPGNNITIQLNLHWQFHPTHDLCFAFVNPLMKAIEAKTGRKPFYTPITDEIIATSEMLHSLSSLEELVMIGYPIGIWDDEHNLPIFRKGYTATHPAIDFKNIETGVILPSIGVVDMACFNGSSGSPIFIFNENGYSDKTGNTYLGASRIMLIGTLYAGPQIKETGTIEVVTIPTSQTVVPIVPTKTNLGYYIKSTELESFRQLIRDNNL